MAKAGSVEGLAAKCPRLDLGGGGWCGGGMACCPFEPPRQGEVLQAEQM